MTDLTNPADIDHWFGDDIGIGPTGDLLLVRQMTRSEQRVLRRLLTAKGDYMMHPDYGAGLPGLIGTVADDGYIEGLISGQMHLEDSVARTPAPTVTIARILNGVRADVQYTDAETKGKTAVGFDLTA